MLLKKLFENNLLDKLKANLPLPAVFKAKGWAVHLNK
jgi:hypothetical protein